MGYKGENAVGRAGDRHESLTVQHAILNSEACDNHATTNITACWVSKARNDVDKGYPSGARLR